MNPVCCCAGIVIEPLFNAFATTAFFEFVVFAIFEMRYLLSVWRARRANALDPWAAQRELSVLYARFYGALLGGIFLMYQLQGCAARHPGQHRLFPAVVRRFRIGRCIAGKSDVVQCSVPDFGLAWVDDIV